MSFVKRVAYLKSPVKQARAIIKMKSDGENITRIARTVSLSRLTIYQMLERLEQGLIELDMSI